MKIPGLVLRTPITITPSLGNTGDGDTYGTPRRVRGDVDQRAAVTQGAEGAAVVAWAKVRIRPTVRVGDPPRPPAVGDLVATPGGDGRPIVDVQPAQGPGRAVSFYTLILGP